MMISKNNKTITAFFLICSVSLLLLLNGCHGYTSDVPQINDTAALEIEPLTFVSGELNSSWVPIAAAIADKTNHYFYGYPVTVSIGGAIANPHLIQKDEAAIGLSQRFYLQSLAEKDDYDESSDNLRGVASLEVRALHFVADHELDVSTIGQAINKLDHLQLGTLPQTDTSLMLLKAVLAEYGIADPKELQAPGTDIYLAEGSSLFKAYTDAYFDCLVIHEAVPKSAIQELMDKRYSRLLSLEPEIIDALSAKYGWVPLVIPAGSYPGQTEDVHTVGMKTVLIAHKDVPEEAIYYLTRSIYENKAYLETIHQAFKSFSINEMPEGLGVPLHPGAMKFYKEVGLLKNREVVE